MPQDLLLLHVVLLPQWPQVGLLCQVALVPQLQVGQVGQGILCLVALQARAGRWTQVVPPPLVHLVCRLSLVSRSCLVVHLTQVHL